MAHAGQATRPTCIDRIHPAKIERVAGTEVARRSTSRDPTSNGGLAWIARDGGADGDGRREHETRLPRHEYGIDLLRPARLGAVRFSETERRPVVLTTAHDAPDSASAAAVGELVATGEKGVDVNVCADEGQNRGAGVAVFVLLDELCAHRYSAGCGGRTRQDSRRGCRAGSRSRTRPRARGRRLPVPARTAPINGVPRLRRERNWSPIRGFLGGSIAGSTGRSSARPPAGAVPLITAAAGMRGTAAAGGEIGSIEATWC